MVGRGPPLIGALPLPMGLAWGQAVTVTTTVAGSMTGSMTGSVVGRLQLARGASTTGVISSFLLVAPLLQLAGSLSGATLCRLQLLVGLDEIAEQAVYQLLPVCLLLVSTLIRQTLQVEHDRRAPAVLLHLQLMEAS